MKILFLQKRVLFPVDNGWRVRTLNVVRYLAQWHEVTYVCNVVPGEEPEVQKMRDLGLRMETVPWHDTLRGTPMFYVKLAANLLSRYPYYADKDYDPRLKALAHRLLEEESYDLVICDFIHMARNALEIHGVPKVLFEHNVETQLLERYAEAQPPGLARWTLRHQARKMRWFEDWAGKQFDAVVAISENDLALYQAWFGWKHAQVIDTAVDVDFLTPSGRAPTPGRVVFIGGLDWPANQEGCKWFVHEVWPKIRAENASATCHLVGRNPPAWLLKLSEHPGVSVFGNVPDVRPYLEDAAVMIAPLLVGGGTRLKIVEAMAAAKAMVSTSLGAEGLPVENGKHLILADDADSFARQTLALLADPARQQALGSAARQHMCDNYSAETVARQFERICQSAVNGRATRQQHTAT